MKTLGIDFGTSTTRVSLRIDGRPPVVLSIGRDATNYIPSVVSLRRVDSGPEVAAVGWEALDVDPSEDTIVVENIKRCLMYKIRPQEANSLPEWWDAERQIISVWGHDIEPTTIVARIIEEALAHAVRAARLEGIQIDEAELRGLPTSIGCPTYSSYEVRRALAGIAKGLGLMDLRLADVIEEPNLAAMAFAALAEFSPDDDPYEDRRTVVVYDLGGGTFDVAIVDLRPGRGGPASLRVLGAGCLPFTGGADIDEAIVRHLIPQIADELDVSAEEVQALRTDEQQRLRRAARALKEELSIAETGSLTVFGVNGKDVVTLPVTRIELEEIVRGTGIVDRTLACTLGAYRQARMVLNRTDGGGYYMDKRAGGVLANPVVKLGLEDLANHVTDVVIVGGSTRIPSLRAQLDGIFGSNKIKASGFLDPVTANAMGATLSREGYLPAVLDCASFEVDIDCGNNHYVVYEPFKPFVSYQTVATSGGPSCLKVSDLNLSDADSAVIKVVDLAGKVVRSNEFKTNGEEHCSFSFDDLGSIRVAGNMMGSLYRDDEPPWLHESQRAALQVRRQEEEERERNRREMLGRNVRRSAYDDVN